MKGIVIGIATTAIAVVILTLLLPQVKYDGNMVHLILIAALIGVVNGFIKPAVKLLTWPINMMTMGLVGIAVNAGLLLAVAWASGQFFKITFTIGGFPTHGLSIEVFVTAAIASIVLGILTAIIGMVVHD